MYDPQANAWTQLASMSNARMGHTSAAVGVKLYVFGVFSYESLLDTAEI